MQMSPEETKPSYNEIVTQQEATPSYDEFVAREDSRSRHTMKSSPEQTSRHTMNELHAGYHTLIHLFNI